jgi:nitrogen-specific signal transduction histidine kinase/ActR/RegA family two-component response regulator
VKKLFVVAQPNVIDLYETPPKMESGHDTVFISTANLQPLWVFDTETFRHAQKMEAMGRLAAGVAHDFYNILTIIQGYAVLMGRGERTKEELNENLNQIIAAAKRGAILTRQMLSYSRRNGMQFEPLDLNGLIDNLGNMLERLLGEDIMLQTHLCPSLKPILGDTGMIEQVIMNLVVNARDAMPNQGRISLRLDSVHIAEKHVELHPQARTGEFACLSVCDNGCGISKEVLARIFEPFFTTKDAEKGTGLGLAIVQEIVQQHGGWIEVRSQPGVGTEFKIYLPCAPTSASRPPRTLHAPSASSDGETILLVEDEEQLRKLTASILRYYGYKVLEASGPAQAQALWREKSNDINLVLTDVVMRGGMSGVEMAKEFSAARPGLKVLYTSGYSAGRGGLDPEIWTHDNFIAKPYSPNRLVQTVQHCLAKQG